MKLMMDNTEKIQKFMKIHGTTPSQVEHKLNSVQPLQYNNNNIVQSLQYNNNNNNIVQHKSNSNNNLNIVHLFNNTDLLQLKNHQGQVSLILVSLHQHKSPVTNNPDNSNITNNLNNHQTTTTKILQM